MKDTPPIITRRLRLEAIKPETLAALLAGDVPAAESSQGKRLSTDFLETVDDFFLQIQLDRMVANAGGREWCARLIVRDDDGDVIGHCGFHGPPEDIGRAEIGYSVLPAFRRQGYAVEAAQGLIDFARAKGRTTVFACVAPSNEASLAVVGRLGFRQTGLQIDEIDGEELVFEIEL
jgi:RimJ/RimL family protein N-acetyltransferase